MKINGCSDGLNCFPGVALTVVIHMPEVNVTEWRSTYIPFFYLDEHIVIANLKIELVAICNALYFKKIRISLPGRESIAVQRAIRFKNILPHLALAISRIGPRTEAWIH